MVWVGVACLVAWWVFPRIFRVFSGMLVGLAGGGVSWCLVAAIWNHFITLGWFSTFIALGIAAGISVTARG